MGTSTTINLEALDDEQLVERAQSGDQAAFAELYNRYFNRIFDFLARMMRNQSEAEDVAQDTFVRAYNSIGGLQSGAKFKSWIFTIARNTALNRIEHSKRTRPLQYEAGEDGEIDLDVVDRDKFSSPDEAVKAAETASLVWAAAAGLNPKQYSLLDLHLRQGLDSAEIADVLGVTKNNGYVMLNRLKAAVEESIGAYVMMHAGRSKCPDLDNELSSTIDGGITPGTRRLIARHVQNCPTCQNTRSELVSPSAILGAFVPIPAAPGIQKGILESVVASGRLGDTREQQMDVPGAPSASNTAIWIGKHVLLLSSAAIAAGILLFLVAFLIPTSGAADPTTGDVTIRFETESGAPVGGVVVALRLTGDDAAQPSLVTGSTSASGTVSFRNISAGIYELTVREFPEQFSLLDAGQSSVFTVGSGQETTVLGVFQFSSS